MSANQHFEKMDAFLFHQYFLSLIGPRGDSIIVESNFLLPLISEFQPETPSFAEQVVENIVFLTHKQIIDSKKTHLPRHDFSVGINRSICTKRRVADKALVHNNTQTPPITSFSITMGVSKNLRRDVIRCTHC